MLFLTRVRRILNKIKLKKIKKKEYFLNINLREIFIYGVCCFKFLPLQEHGLLTFEVTLVLEVQYQ